jgi:hypothetical protein
LKGGARDGWAVNGGFSREPAGCRRIADLF